MARREAGRPALADITQHRWWRSMFNSEDEIVVPGRDDGECWVWTRPMKQLVNHAGKYHRIRRLLMQEFGESGIEEGDWVVLDPSHAEQRCVSPYHCEVMDPADWGQIMADRMAMARSRRVRIRAIGPDTDLNRFQYETYFNREVQDHLSLLNSAKASVLQALYRIQDPEDEFHDRPWAYTAADKYNDVHRIADELMDRVRTGRLDAPVGQKIQLEDWKV